MSLFKIKKSIATYLVLVVVASCIATTIIYGLISAKQIFEEKKIDTLLASYLELERESSRISRWFQQKVFTFSQFDYESSLELKSGKTYQLVSHRAQIGGLEKAIGDDLTRILSTKSLSKKEVVCRNFSGRTFCFWFQSDDKILVVPADVSFNSFNSVEISEIDLLLLDERGDLIYKSKGNTSISSKQALIQEFIKSPLRTGSFSFTDASEERYFGVYSQVPKTNLVLFLKLPYLAIYKKLIQPMKNFLITSSIVSVVMVIIVLFIAKNMTKPVADIKKLSQQVGTGQFDEVDRSGSFGEFGEVKSALLSMIDSLKARDQKIQQFVLEETEKARRKTELDLAENLQKSFLPENDIAIKGRFELESFYKASSELAGDWYSFRYDDSSQRLVVALVDVAGHGAASGLLTASIAGAYINSLKNISENSIEEFLNSSNNMLLSLGKNRMHATAVVVMVDFNEKEISLYNCGHQFPIICYDRLKVRPLISGSTPIGIEENLEWHKEKINIDHDLRLFLFTDGLVESLNEKGKAFGNKRLVKHLKETVNEEISISFRSVLNNWRLFSGAQSPEDDTCAIILDIAA